MDLSLRLMPTKEGYKANNDFKMSYQSMVGSLMYTILSTRPDIAFSVLLSAAILAIRTIYTSKQSKISTGTSVALQTTSSAFKAPLSHLLAILTPYRVMTPP
jgi:hypothetical protein